MSPLGEEYGAGQRFLIGAGKSTQDTVDAIKQIFYKAIGNDPEYQALRQRRAEEAARFQKDFEGDVATGAGEFAGMVGSTMLPGIGAVGKGAGAMAKLAAGGAAAGALSPVEGDNFAAEKALQAGMGAGVGMVAPYALSAAGKGAAAVGGAMRDVGGEMLDDYLARIGAMQFAAPRGERLKGFAPPSDPAAARAMADAEYATAKSTALQSMPALTEESIAALNALPPEQAKEVVKQITAAGRAREKAAEKAAKMSPASPADQARWAEGYPSVEEPTIAFDKTKGKFYLSKGPSVDAIRMAALREAAQAEVDQGAAKGVYDVANRYHVPEDVYAKERGVRTVDVANPKTQKKLDEFRAKYDTPEVRARLMAAFERGKQDPGSERWYGMGEEFQGYVDQFGPEEGARLFMKNFADPMAATTGGADPTANALMAQYGNVIRESGGQFPPSHSLPYPIGGRYAAGNLDMYDKVLMQGRGLDPYGQPKRYNFSGNFLGRPGSTIDEQMMTGVEPSGKLKAPPGDSYGAIESVVNDIARQLGRLPQDTQDVMWRGLKNAKDEAAFLEKGGKAEDFVAEKAKPMIEIYGDAIYRTAKVTGLPIDEVKRRVRTGKMPLYAVGGATAVPLSQAFDERTD